MIYIQSKVDNKYIIADTERPDFKKIATKQEILENTMKYKFEINGVDIYEKEVFIVKSIDDIIKEFKQGKYKEAIKIMPVTSYYIGMHFKSKASSEGGEMTFVINRVINIRRTGCSGYQFDEGTPSTFKYFNDSNDLIQYLSQYKGWQLVEIKKGRF